MKEKQSMYFGGVPVEPDVKLLLDHLGVPEAGTDISHEEVERALGISRTKNRYRTVTWAWRQRLQDDKNVVVLQVPDGFHALTAVERLGEAERQGRKGTRRIVQAVKVVVSTPVNELPERELPRHTHLMRASVMKLKALRDHDRAYGLALKAPPEGLPKPRPPE